MILSSISKTLQSFESQNQSHNALSMFIQVSRNTHNALSLLIVDFEIEISDYIEISCADIRMFSAHCGLSVLVAQWEVFVRESERSLLRFRSAFIFL